MNRAYYINKDEAKYISPYDISSRKEYCEKYSGNLYCPTNGCSAQLDYVELPYLGHEKIFRTHKGSEHIDSCPHNIIHKNGSGISFSSETFSQNISDSHIKSVLDGLYKRNTIPNFGYSSSTKRGVTKHRDTDTPPIPTKRAVASLDPNAEPTQVGVREPSVRKRRSQDLLAEDNNMLRGIDGIVDSAYIGADFVEFHFCSTNCPVSLIFYNAFRDKSNLAYYHITQLANMLNSSALKVLVCCVGIVETTPSGISVQIMSPDYITIEGMSIYNYMNILSA